MKVDVDGLETEVKPYIEKTITKLENAQNTFSGIDVPEDFFYWFQLKSMPTDIYNMNERLKEAKRWVEEKIQSFGGAESSNKGILDSIKASIASNINTSLGFIKGGAKIVETGVDFASIVSTIMQTPATLGADTGNYLRGLLTGEEENFKSYTEEMWKNTMSFVATEHVENAYDWFFQDTSAGQWLDTNAYDPCKSDGIVTEIYSGIGYVAGIAALTIATGGIGGVATGATTTSSTIISAGIATTSGTAKYTEEAWAKMRHSAGEGEEWRTLENAGRGLGYGTLNGLWEGAQYLVGGKLASWAGTGSKVVTSTIRVGADTAFNALDTPFRATTSIITGNTFEEGWAEQGGWKSLLINAGIGLIGATGGEVFDNVKIKPKNTNNDNDFAQSIGFFHNRNERKNTNVNIEKNSKILEFDNYFKNNKVAYDRNRLENALDGIEILKTQGDVANKFFELSGNQSPYVRAFAKLKEGGAVYFEGNTKIEVDHELFHNMGNMHGTSSLCAENVKYKTRGIDEATTQCFACDKNGWKMEEGDMKTAYNQNAVRVYNLREYLKKTTGGDVWADSYNKKTADVARYIDNIGGEGTYSHIVELMDIADWSGFYDFSNPTIRKQAIDANTELDEIVRKLINK